MGDGGVGLEVGRSGRFEGVYHAHWEWSRFELIVASRWRRRRVRCELVSDQVPWPRPITELAESGRRGPGGRFAVTIDAEVLARGHFGLHGTLRWRLGVRRWVAVEPLS